MSLREKIVNVQREVGEGGGGEGVLVIEVATPVPRSVSRLEGFGRIVL